MQVFHIGEHTLSYLAEDKPPKTTRLNALEWEWLRLLAATIVDLKIVKASMCGTRHRVIFHTAMRYHRDDITRLVDSTRLTAFHNYLYHTHSDVELAVNKKLPQGMLYFAPALSIKMYSSVQKSTIAYSNPDLFSRIIDADPTAVATCCDPKLLAISPRYHRDAIVELLDSKRLDTYIVELLMRWDPSTPLNWDRYPKKMALSIGHVYNLIDRNYFPQAKALAVLIPWTGFEKLGIAAKCWFNGYIYLVKDDMVFDASPGSDSYTVLIKCIAVNAACPGSRHLAEYIHDSFFLTLSPARYARVALDAIKTLTLFPPICAQSSAQAILKLFRLRLGNNMDSEIKETVRAWRNDVEDTAAILSWIPNLGVVLENEPPRKRQRTLLC